MFFGCALFGPRCQKREVLKSHQEKWKTLTDNLSLMKKWQLITTRVRPALPQHHTKSQLRELGLRQSLVDSQIFVGDQLCVMLHEHVMLIGGEKLQQECFLTKLSACVPLEDTRQLDEKTTLNFLGRSLEYSRAERSISLHLPSAFYLQLLQEI